MDDAYEKILERATELQARTLLNIIVAAERPLTLHEMNFALAVNERLESGGLCLSYKDLDLEPEERFRIKVRNIYGLFVNIVDSKIDLIHQTAKEFLMDTRSTGQAVNPTYPGLGGWKYSLKKIQSNLILGKICISYLHFDEFEPDIGTHSVQGYNCYAGGRYTLPKEGLQVYAARSWVSHFRVAQNIVDQPLRHLALGICDPQTNRYKYCFQICTTCYTYDYLDHTSLTATTFLGLQTLVKMLLEECGVDVNSTDGKGHTALTWAAKRGHVDIVRLLVQRGGKVDYEDTTSRNPLSWAAECGELDIVQMLLNEGAVLDSKDDKC